MPNSRPRGGAAEAREPRGRDHRRWVQVTERAIYLRSIPVAAMVPPRVLHAIASHLHTRQYEPGYNLLTAGEPVRTLHLLTRGTVELSVKDKVLGKLSPPQSAGFLNLIARSDAAYNATVVDPVECLDLSGEVLLDLMEEHFSLLYAVVRYAAERLQAEQRELPQEDLGLPPMTIPFEVAERPLDLVERILFLRQLAVFQKTNLNSLAVLSQQMKELRLPVGTTLWRHGEASDEGLMMVKGAVECVTADGRHWTYGPGTVVGGVDSLAGSVHWYSATVVEPVVGLRAVTQELLDAFEDDFELAMDFVSMLAKGLQMMLARKAMRGESTIGRMRNVSKLGSIPVGA